jgi:hypothetical protein
MAAFLNVVGTVINAGSLSGFSANIAIDDRTLVRNSEYQSALAWKCVMEYEGYKGKLLRM